MDSRNQVRDLALIAGTRAGEPEAKEEIVRKYLPMVKHIVKRHYASFLDFDDLMQEGFIGLLAAIDEYRPEAFDVKFSSFAYICIIRKVYNAIKQSNGNKHKLLNGAVSLQGFVSPHETRTMMDVVADACSGHQFDPVEAAEAKMIEERVRLILRAHLSTLEYTVITLLLQGYSCAEIEGALGIKAKAVDNARTRVKAKLKRILTKYGSLLHPAADRTARRRPDLYADVHVGSG